MPNRLILEVGAGSAEIPIKGTATQIRAAIRRYALSRGVGVETLTPTQIAEAVLRELLKLIRNASLDRHRAELLAAQQAALEATLAAENDLYDEPAPPVP